MVGSLLILVWRSSPSSFLRRLRLSFVVTEDLIERINVLLLLRGILDFALGPRQRRCDNLWVLAFSLFELPHLVGIIGLTR